MSCTKGQRNLSQQALELKLQHRGPHVYFRGLIEISNKCKKNCLYCGIRGGNCNVQRYEMTDEQVLQEAQFALNAGYGSLAIQGGERQDSEFVERITRLVSQIRQLQPGGNPLDVLNRPSGTASAPKNELGITLSLGEQPIEVYREWLKAGATRYLLRIESSNKELYEKIHPGFTYTGNNTKDAQLHSYDRRVQALYDLKSAGYLLGSGVMIGLPFQTRENLDEDLKFLKDLQVDMVGMGPYIPHKDTPLGQIVSHWKDGIPLPDSASPVPLCQGRESQMGVGEPEDSGKLSGGYNLHALVGLPRGDFWKLSGRELLELCLDMVARLRFMMPHINIAATTALQVLDPMGREMALMHGANVIMPNMTETSLRGNYSLYEGKHGVEDDAASTRDKLLDNLSALGIPVGWNLRGDWR